MAGASDYEGSSNWKFLAQTHLQSGSDMKPSHIAPGIVAASVMSHQVNSVLFLESLFKAWFFDVKNSVSYSMFFE